MASHLLIISNYAGAMFGFCLSSNLQQIALWHHKVDSFSFRPWQEFDLLQKFAKKSSLWWQCWEFLCSSTLCLTLTRFEEWKCSYKENKVREGSSDQTKFYLFVIHRCHSQLLNLEHKVKLFQNWKQEEICFFFLKSRPQKLSFADILERENGISFK